MTFYVYFPDKTVDLSPLPKFTLSFQRAVEFHASLPGLSKKAEYGITRVQVALQQVGYLSKVVSYITYPAILISMQTLSLLIQAANPFYMSVFVISKIAFSVLALAFTAKWTLDGSLPQLSKDLYNFSRDADGYVGQINSNLRDFNSESYKKVVFSSPPPQLPDSKLSRPINSFVQYVYSQGLKVSQYLGLV